MTDTDTIERQGLAPASELAEASETRWPGESADYRAARTELLAEEIELRRQIQRVAEQRRALPPGPEAKDYRFLGEGGKEVSLADLFGEHDTLFTYFWMYGPERERPCPMCTSFVGSLDIPAPDIEQRIALAIIGRSPVARQLAFARERGWSHLNFYQTVGEDFTRDYRGMVDGEEWPIVAVWKREGDKVRLFWAAEGGAQTADPGFDPHLAPDPTPLWNILDWTPGGRGTDWYPKLEYGDEGNSPSWRDVSPILGMARICADVPTRGLDRARRFYEGVLGLTPARTPDDRGVYYRAGDGTMLNLYERAYELSEQAVATFLVDDIDRIMRALRDRGVVFEEYDEPDLQTYDGVFSDSTGFKVSWFKDPDGNILSLEQLPQIVHDHNSAPFDPESGKGRVDLKPEATGVIAREKTKPLHLHKI